MNIYYYSLFWENILVKWISLSYYLWYDSCSRFTRRITGTRCWHADCLVGDTSDSCYTVGNATTDVAVTRHCIKGLEGLHPVPRQGLRARAPPVFCPPPPGFIERTTITRCVPSKTTTWLLGCREWSADCLFFDWVKERWYLLFRLNWWMATD